ncbi:MAG: hypothetical protein ABI321_06140 [Polyangia bacterium]
MYTAVFVLTAQLVSGSAMAGRLGSPDKLSRAIATEQENRITAQAQTDAARNEKLQSEHALAKTLSSWRARETQKKLEQHAKKAEAKSFLRSLTKDEGLRRLLSANAEKRRLAGYNGRDLPTGEILIGSGSDHVDGLEFRRRELVLTGTGFKETSFYANPVTTKVSLHPLAIFDRLDLAKWMPDLNIANIKEKVAAYR